MKNSNTKKIVNTVLLLAAAALIMFVLYTLYERLKPANPELIPPQQEAEGTTGVNGEKEQNNYEREATQDDAVGGNDYENEAEEKNEGVSEEKDDKEDNKEKDNVGEAYIEDKKDEKGEEESKEDDEEKPQKVMAPDFTLEDLDGNKVSLSDYRGKIVFLNFWATWCIYCVQEMPDLESANRKLAEAGDAVIVTVNQMEDRDTVRKFMEDNKLTLTALMDFTGEVNYTYGAVGIPLTYVIDKDGSVFGRIPGRTDEETILRVAEMLRDNNE